MNQKITPDKQGKIITPQIEDYIKRAVRAGNSYSDVARELKISWNAVKNHYTGKVKVRFCVVCGGPTPRGGEYCCKRACQNVYAKKYLDKRPDKRLDNVRITLKWQTHNPGRTHYKAKECVCATCGKTYVGYQKPSDKYKNTYCSQLCCWNRVKVASEITRRIENITVLSGQIVKEKPVVVEKVESIGSLMRKTPESQEHMRG